MCAAREIVRKNAHHRQNRRDACAYLVSHHPKARHDAIKNFEMCESLLCNFGKIQDSAAVKKKNTGIWFSFSCKNQLFIALLWTKIHFHKVLFYFYTFLLKKIRSKIIKIKSAKMLPKLILDYFMQLNFLHLLITGQFASARSSPVESIKH